MKNLIPSFTPLVRLILCAGWFVWLAGCTPKSQVPVPSPTNSLITPVATSVQTPTPQASPTPGYTPGPTPTRQEQLNIDLNWTCTEFDGNEAIQEAKQLVKKGAQINALSPSGYRPLCHAVEMGSHAGQASLAPDGDNPNSALLVKWLLAHGADPNLPNCEQDWETGELRKNNPGISPLEFALGAAHECSPQPSIVRALLRAGAKVNIQFAYTNETASRYSGYSTPLGAAAMWGDTEIMEMLYRAGAKVNGRDRIGRTPIMHAARVVGFWAGGAARSNSDTAMPFLLRRGAHINARDNKGWTALFYAIAEESHDEDNKYLLEGSANIAAVKFLLRHGAAINTCDKRGRTPLMWAAFYKVDDMYADSDIYKMRQQALVRYLLQHGANPKLRDNNGRTAHDLAAIAHNVHVLRVLK